MGGMDIKTPAKEAIKSAGGQIAMARKLADIEPLGLSEDKALWRVQKWAYNGIPPKFVITVEKLSGICRTRLRPDIYPPDDAA